MASPAFLGYLCPHLDHLTKESLVAEIHKDMREQSVEHIQNNLRTPARSNIGISNRLIRLAIALALLPSPGGRPSWILLAIPLFVFYEALAGWCLYYQLIGKNSCRLPRK